MTVAVDVWEVQVPMKTKHRVWIALPERTAALMVAVAVPLVGFPTVLVPMPAVTVWQVPTAMALFSSMV